MDNFYKYKNLIAIVAILIAIFTWYLDIYHIVHQCPYCRVQRTIIGVLAIILLLPTFLPTITRIITYALAFFGADISGDQVFLSVKIGIFPTLNATLAICALLWIIFLTLLIHHKCTA